MGVTLEAATDNAARGMIMVAVAMQPDRNTGGVRMRRLTRTARILTPVGVALSLLTACGGGSSHGAGDTSHGDGAAGATKAKAYDPPLEFADLGAEQITGEGAWNVA